MTIEVLDEGGEITADQWAYLLARVEEAGLKLTDEEREELELHRRLDVALYAWAKASRP